MIYSRGIISLLGAFCWLQLIHSDAANAFYTSRTQQLTSRQYASSSSPLHKLYGISEWRAKFSSPSNSSQATDDATLPLLLLPFEPTQILLPGQSTTLKFRHGKYMDMIDESLTSYESVVGMSILDEDGLLPYVVVCEVLEEELEVNMGYRGFGGMEVGVRAVGRAKRIPNVEVEKLIRGSSLGDNSFRGRAALDEIHLGRFVEWHDDALDGDKLEAASECLGNIQNLLMLSQQFGTSGDEPPEADDRMRHQQMLFREAYEMTMEQFATSTTNSGTELSARLVASSWAAFAVAEGRRASSNSVIARALATKDTVERLRLGLALMLENQMPSRSDSVGDTSGDMKKLNLGDSLFGNQDDAYQ